jgi:hypothetical protein
MPKAYNPKAVVPSITGKFHSGTKELQAIREAQRADFLKMFDRGRPGGAKHPGYKEVWDIVTRGEGHTLGHYASEMTFDIYPGMEDKFMNGAWDTHGHIFPDYVPRKLDIIDYAIKASQAKMGGIVCKDHFTSTMGQAWAAQWVVDEMVRKGELDYACKVLGTYILAWDLDPTQIFLMRNYPNLGAIFFNTMTGHDDNDQLGSVHHCGHLLRIIDNNNKLTPQAKECIDLCAEYKIPIMTGHRVYRENLAIVKEAARVGHAEHVLITHAEHMSGVLKQSKELGEMGAQLEMNAAHAIPGLIMPTADPNYFPKFMEFVGPEHCHINTDWGQPIAMDPVEGLRLFIIMLMHWGFSDKDIRTMTHDNPEKLLFLRD